MQIWIVQIDPNTELLTGWIIHSFLLICSNLFCLKVSSWTLKFSTFHFNVYFTSFFCEKRAQNVLTPAGYCASICRNQSWSKIIQFVSSSSTWSVVSHHRQSGSPLSPSTPVSPSGCHRPPASQGWCWFSSGAVLVQVLVFLHQPSTHHSGKIGKTELPFCWCIIKWHKQLL